MTKKPTKNPPSPMTKTVIRRKPWKSKRKNNRSAPQDKPTKCRIVLIEDEYE